MNFRQLTHLVFAALLATVSVASAADENSAPTLRVLQFNVWQEGTSVPGGLQMIADVIVESRADVVAFSEVRNYRGGDWHTKVLAALQAKAPDAKFHGRFVGGDVGLISRFPINSAVPVVDKTKADNGSVMSYRLAVPGGREITVCSAHLDYRHYALNWVRGYGGGDPDWKMRDADEDGEPDRITDVEALLAYNRKSQRGPAIAAFLAFAAEERTAGRAVILAGDFNEASHLDWTERAKNFAGHYGAVVAWESSLALERAGFRDAWRVVFPDELKHPGFTWPAPAVGKKTTTWTPKSDERDRIDFIHYSADAGLRPLHAWIVGPRASFVGERAVDDPGDDPRLCAELPWPSDHKAVLVEFALPSPQTSAAASPKKPLPLPGDVFEVEGRTAFLIFPKTTSAAKQPVPWVWYAPTLPNLPGPEEKWMFERFTEAGIAIAGIDVGESYGSPDGRALFSAFYKELTTRRGLAAKPVLIGRSRGGLMTLAWAAENPDKVAGFAGIYPVCNVASYPGLAKASGAYRMTEEELSARLSDHNPIDRLAALAKTGVPLFAIHGDSDKVVPLEANSGELHKRYDALGGTMQLIIPPGQGHNMWSGFFQCQELVDFVIGQTTGTARPASITLSSPLERQVVQRATKEKGHIVIAGSIAGTDGKADGIEARVITDGKGGGWQRLAAVFRDAAFEATMEGPAGGWYRLEVRATSGGQVVAETAVAQVGVGEVFIVAGQSNSANHGAEKQTTSTGLVATFDGQRWHLANDPQPGASGGGGSFLPPFGDAIARRFAVPIGFIACGIGSTSVREWLPKGTRFPNPPTLESRVQKLPDGEWESKGQAFANFVQRLKQAGPRGFRAVLWHQGESDANQKDATRTLPGALYREHLETVIRESRRQIGWDAPWFVAQVSYHLPGDEASPDIRDAQAALWKNGIALEGPDSDAIKGEFRENGGMGVHFSGSGLREHAARWVEKVAPWLEQQFQ